MISAERLAGLFTFYTLHYILTRVSFLSFTFGDDSGGDVQNGFVPSERRAVRQPNRKNSSSRSPDGNARAMPYSKEDSLQGQSPHDVHLRDHNNSVVPDNNDNST